VGFTNQKAAIEGSQAQRLDGEQKKISIKKERFQAKKKDFKQKRKISSRERFRSHKHKSFLLFIP